MDCINEDLSGRFAKGLGTERDRKREIGKYLVRKYRDQMRIERMRENKRQKENKRPKRI